MTEKYYTREELVSDIRLTLSDPVDEVHYHSTSVFTSGDPGEVVVTVTNNRVSVAEFRVVWEQPHLPVVRPKAIATLRWPLIPVTELRDIITRLIFTTQMLRHSRYRTCEICDKTNPPEWMFGEKCCNSCAEKHLGVNF